MGRFEENRGIKDLRVAAKIVEDGEYELWANQHQDPRTFKTDPGGIVYNREGDHPDWLFDQSSLGEGADDGCLWEEGTAQEGLPRLLRELASQEISAGSSRELRIISGWFSNET